jgi:L-ascorbate metabolism protein UlaG (beta-lactamase superfamily)
LIDKPFTASLATLCTRSMSWNCRWNYIAYRSFLKPLLHADLTLGYRISIAGKVVAYCPATGYCDNVARMGRHADLLIAECAYRIGESGTSWPHLNPEGAARVAREAGAKNLVLVHFDASRYKTLGGTEKKLRSTPGRYSQTRSLPWTG